MEARDSTRTPLEVFNADSEISGGAPCELLPQEGVP